jgi:hypothetical protein
MSIRGTDYTELQRVREHNAALQKELWRREVADALAAQEKLKDEQAAAEAAAAEASRVSRAAELEKARKSAWRNHFVNQALAGGHDSFVRYLDRPGEMLERECDQPGWPPGTSPDALQLEALVPEPEETDEHANSTIGKALAAVGRKRI